MVPRKLMKKLFPTIPLFLLLGCNTNAEDQLQELPVPPWIRNYEAKALPDGRTQLSFDTQEAYPSTRVRDFYENWAESHGWSKVSPETDPWSADRWVSYTDMEGRRIDQFSVSWLSPDRTKSLSLALLHIENRQQQEAYVIESVFYESAD